MGTTQGVDYQGNEMSFAPGYTPPQNTWQNASINRAPIAGSPVVASSPGILPAANSTPEYMQNLQNLPSGLLTGYR